MGQLLQKLHLGKNKATEGKEEIERQISDSEDSTYFSDLDFRITKEEISVAINNLKSKKGAGYDGIMAKMIKATKEILLPCLEKILYFIFRSKKYPKEWNQGVITPIHKKGPKHDPNNYRGITINSTMAKIYSMILCSRLKDFLEVISLINDTQIGFKGKSQTVDHILLLQALSEKYIDQGNLHLCFIDLRKAYDSLWRKALLLKLQNMNVKGLFYHQIKSMYENVKVCIKHNDALSDDFFPTEIVKQGEVLSPLLFNIFINDINDIFSEECDPVTLNTRKMSCLQYADDLVILVQSKEGLQTCLDRLDVYCKTWKLEVNVDKSKYMIMSKKKSKDTTTVNIGNQHLQKVTEYSYLGVTIASNGSYGICKDSLKQKGRKVMNKLKGLISGGGGGESKCLWH